jgi:hypothetical protein
MSPIAAVGVSSMGDVDDGHGLTLVIDAVDDAVSATPGAVAVIERRLQPLPDSMGIVQKCADDELVRGERHGRG